MDNGDKSSLGSPTRARAIMVRDGGVLLIERWRGERHFLVFHGGGIKDEGTPAVAARREVAEETGLVVAVGPLTAVVVLSDKVQHFFWANIVEGHLGTGHGEEFANPEPAPVEPSRRSGCRWSGWLPPTCSRRLFGR